jgi:hypothetical protein
MDWNEMSRIALHASMDYCYTERKGNEATAKWLLSLEEDVLISSVVDRWGGMTEKQIIKEVEKADRLPADILNARLISRVHDISYDYMNAGKGDGTVAHCFSDEEIIAKFSNKKMSTVEKMVKRIDKNGADLFNEVRMFSGEYEMRNGIAEPKN